MPGAVLRVRGSKTNLRRFLARSRWEPSPIHFVGERYGKTARLSEYNGFNLHMSLASGYHLDHQVKDVLKFLRQESQELARIRRFKLRGLIDFGVMKRRGRIATFCHVPLALVDAASRHHLPIEISLYDVT